LRYTLCREKLQRWSWKVQWIVAREILVLIFVCVWKLLAFWNGHGCGKGILVSSEVYAQPARVLLREVGLLQTSKPGASVVGDTARICCIQDIRELEAAEEITILVNNFCKSGSSSFQVVGGYDKVGAARAERSTAPTSLSS
jgi:hypothetical protein